MANLVIGHVSPLSWSGFRDDVFGRLEAEMDKFLSDMINPKSVQRMKGDNYPKTDIYQNGHNLCFDLAVPFCKKEDIKVTIEDGVLTVSGKAEEVDEKEQRNYAFKEIRRSAFTRSWSLESEAIKRPDLCFDEDDVIAELKDGILTISIVDYFAGSEYKKPAKKEIKIK